MPKRKDGGLVKETKESQNIASSKGEALFTANFKEGKEAVGKGIKLERSEGGFVMNVV